MSAGYVLDFKDRTFYEFVMDAIGINIYDPKYQYRSGSKANCLRGFWLDENNYLVGKLMSALISHREEIEAEYLASSNTYTSVINEGAHRTAALRDQCRKIVERLVKSHSVAEVDALSAVSDEKDFEIVARVIRDSIERHEPELGLDRLHTFVVKYVRTLCAERGLIVIQDKPLHSLFGEYVKSIQGSGLIESEMTIRILKSGISTLEAFNDVRNNRSLAHDNPILNYDEALLIFNHVASSVRFLNSLQKKIQIQQKTSEAAPAILDDEVPF